jgi:hypothetical protein
MHEMALLLAKTVAEGLQRKSIVRCSDWTCKYRVMDGEFAGPWTFKHHPWLKDMHDCQDELIIGQKSAQMGYTECVLNRAFKAIDIDHLSVLYILPTQSPDATDFSKSRFDAALDQSPHLSKLFSDVKNVGHKRAGGANFLLRGSRSRSGLKSNPASLVIADEVDEMVQSNISMMFERASGHSFKSFFLLSTPTISEYGINSYFKQSSQDHFFFKCPHCGRSTELIFPECLVITSEDYSDTTVKDTYIICKECKAKLNHETKHEWLSKGEWVSTYKNKMSKGFYINQLYSSTVRPYELAVLYLKSRFDPSAEQEFYNSKLGLTHTVKGARIDDEDIVKCIRSHKKVDRIGPNTFTTMGVDVGTYLHYEIDEWFLKEGEHSEINNNAVCKLICEGKTRDFSYLSELMTNYNINMCVIDADPERRASYEFARKFYGRVKMCLYRGNIAGKQINMHSEEECTIVIDRTSWLDLSLSRFKDGSIHLPIDVSLEYRQHIKALVRVYDYGKESTKDVIDLKPKGRYVRGSEDDHFAHARNYSELALAIAYGQGVSTDIMEI